jgi:hypothetical protein
MGRRVRGAIQAAIIAPQGSYRCAAPRGTIGCSEGRFDMSAKFVRMVVLAASALAVASTLVATTADAMKTVNIASHVSIKSTGLTFSGKVTSSNAACVTGRKVTLYRTNGNVLGSITTGSSGRWKITAQGSAGITLGHFYAKAKRRSEGTAGTIYVCGAAVSPTIPYHQ